MAYYWSNFALDRLVPLFKALTGGKPINSRRGNWPQETRNIRGVWHEVYLGPIGIDQECTERWINGQTDILTAKAVIHGKKTVCGSY